jgi:hypothetical protein
VLTNNAARNVKLAIQRMADSGDAVAAAAHCIDAAAKLAVPGRGQDEQR